MTLKRICSLLMLICSPVLSGGFSFSPELLGEDAAGVDISLFNDGLQQPGIYQFDVEINGEFIDSREINLLLTQSKGGQKTLTPCFTREMLSAWRVDTSTLKASPSDTEDECFNLNDIPDATTYIDISNQLMRITVPQAFMLFEHSGLAPVNLWDDGITAATLTYDAGISRTEYLHDVSRMAWGQLSPGFNVGPWRQRNLLNWHKDASGFRLTRESSYAERGIYQMRSRLTLGEIRSEGLIFDSSPFTGVMLGSDDEMVPYTELQYSPVINGIAKSSSKVEVYQSGRLIYTKMVSPGPFSFKDFTGGSGGGDLLVRVIDETGQINEFHVYYQKPAIALKKGGLKYNVLAGQYRPVNVEMKNDFFAEGSLIYGLSEDLTLYGGVVTNNDYTSFSFGAGRSLGRIGSVSIDNTLSRFHTPYGEVLEGASQRVRYSNSLSKTDSRINVSYAKISDGEYLNLSDSMYKADSKSTRSYGLSEASELMGSISQSLNRLGSVYVTSKFRSGSDGERSRSLGLSWGSQVGSVSVSANLTTNKITRYKMGPVRDNSASLWLSMPLGSANSNNFTSVQIDTASGQPTSINSMMNGQAIDNRLSWSLRQEHQRHVSGGDKSSVRASWRHRSGVVSGNYSYADQFQHMGADINGALILHENGVTLGQQNGDTGALIYAAGANETQISYSATDRLNSQGYAYLTHLSPYRDNTLSVNPLTVTDDVEFMQSEIKIVPTKGAIVDARFNTRAGARGIMTIQTKEGTRIPLGTKVRLNQQKWVAGFVDSKQQVYLTGLAPAGKLKLTWAGQNCVIAYDTKGLKKSAGVYKLVGQCEDEKI